MPSKNLTAIYAQHTNYIQKLGASEGLKVIPYLELIENDVSAILNKYRKRNVTDKLREKILAEVNEASRKHLQDYVSALKISNRELGTYEGEFAADTLAAAVDLGDYEPIQPTAAEVNKMAIARPVQLGGGSFTSYTIMMTRYWQRWSDEIDGIVQAGMINGASVREISKDILASMDLSKTGTTASTLDKARRAAKQLAITGHNHYANQARVAFVDKNDRVLKGYRFLAVNDSRTSKQCRALDQTVIAKDDPDLNRYTPPLHPNCRSALVYEVDDKYKLEDSTKASSFEVDGKRTPKQVSTDNIYYENLDALKASDQDAVLGVALGKAFRKLNDPKKFASLQLDDLNRPLTLKQMKQRNNELSRILRAQTGS